MFIQAYLQTAVAIVHEFRGEEPLPSFLKKYFSRHKKFGSRDRKQISHLCFCYYRLGKSLPEVEVAERMLLGLFLCSTAPQPVLAVLKPQWNQRITRPLQEKIALVQQTATFSVDQIFPFPQLLSPLIPHANFAASFLIQPDTYLRIRPGNEQTVRRKLQEKRIIFTDISEHCIAVAPATKLEEILAIDAEAVIQDYNSQQVLSLLARKMDKNRRFSSWDCCAASGGKSLLLHDAFPLAGLTVSDIRESILANLRKRFQQAGISQYKWFVADVSQPDFRLQQQFDVIICDAPCSGSGTWSRTPEQLYFFGEEKIAYYANLQRSIALNAQKQLKPGGWFLYITCSVFQQENEDVVAFLQQAAGLSLHALQYFKGYQQKADTLFAALLQKKEGV